MKIETQITPADYAAFSNYVKRSAVRKPAYVFCVGLAVPVGIVGGLLAAKLGPQQNDTTPLLLITGFVIGLVYLYLLGICAAVVLARKLRPSATGYILRPQTIETTDDCLRVSSDAHQSEFRWTLIPHPDMTRDHLFVMVDAISAIIVPLRSFASNDARDQFVNDIRKRSKRARSYRDEP